LNVANPPAPAKGGADNILYGNCFWDLAQGEVLLLDCAPPDAQYFGFTIHTLGWLESGDFADRQTSLSGHQVHVDADGRMRIIISHEDPGAPNWIDTEGRRSGLLVYRWVWSRDNPVPVSKVIPVERLREHVPADHPRVDEQARRRSLSQRREAAWNRFL
jgi:hypothetical protein